MPETATGIHMKSLDRVQRLLAASATFQDLVGAADADEALLSVHCPEATDEDVRPYAIVGPAPDWRTRKVGTAMWASEGEAQITIEASVPEAHSESTKDELVYFKNRADGIVTDMQVLAGRGESVPGESHINLIRMTIEDLGRVDVSELPHNALGDQTSVWWTVIRVEWF
jgi:hypothetical protein